VPLHVFRHVEAHQFVTEAVRQLLGDLGLADAGGARKEEAADGLGGVAEARTSHLDRPGERVDGRILAKNDGFQVAVEIPQVVAVVGRDVRRRDARNLGDDFLDVDLADQFFLPTWAGSAARRPLRR
jgi:hypothetical protein